MEENQQKDPKNDMPFTKSLVKQELKRIMDACDADAERDFLREFGKLRQMVVYEEEYLTDDQFDAMCQELLDEIEAGRNED